MVRGVVRVLCGLNAGCSGAYLTALQAWLTSNGLLSKSYIYIQNEPQGAPDYKLAALLSRVHKVEKILRLLSSKEKRWCFRETESSNLHRNMLPESRLQCQSNLVQKFSMTLNSVLLESTSGLPLRMSTTSSLFVSSLFPVSFLLFSFFRPGNIALGNARIAVGEEVWLYSLPQVQQSRIGWHDLSSSFDFFFVAALESLLESVSQRLQRTEHENCHVEQLGRTSNRMGLL
jgi:hypothetical protein